MKLLQKMKDSKSFKQVKSLQKIMMEIGYMQHEEIRLFHENKICELIELPDNQKAISNKWCEKSKKHLVEK